MEKNKKIAYLGKMSLADNDISYLHEAQKIADITYYVEVCPRYMKGPAISIRALYQHTGIYKAKEVYTEFERYSEFVDLDKFYVVNTCGKLWLLKSFWINLLLLVKLISEKYSVIHVAWPLNLYEFFLYALHKKMVLTVHDPFPHSGNNSFNSKFRRFFAFKFINNFIVLNESQRQEFVEYYGLKKANVITSRLSSYIFLQAIDKSVREGQNDYILSFGRISQYKGFDYLLPAMQKVHESHPDCKLIIAGSGKFYFDISKYQGLDYIEFRNRFIPDDEMVELIKNALFVVCPYTDATQSGVVMSSYAFYRPVIATNVGGLPEMVQDRRHGLIIKEKDVNALVYAINYLLDNKNIIENFSSNIEADYTIGELSWKNTARKLVKEYDKIFLEQEQ